MAIISSGITISGGWSITGSDGPAVTPTVEYLLVAGGGSGGACGNGAVRIIWGTGRAFPSTNTGNL